MGKKENKIKTAIRKAALVLFVQKGLKDVIMKDICEVAGSSHGGLYTHHGSIGQVFTDIVNELMSGLKSQVAEKMERDLPAAPILDELLERYQPEMLDRSGLLGLAFYECHGGIPLSEDNAMLRQHYVSKTMLCNPIKYGTNKGEFKQVNVDAVVDLLPLSYQGIRMLSSIMPLDDDNILKDMISEIRATLAEQKMAPGGKHG